MIGSYDGTASRTRIIQTVADRSDSGDLAGDADGQFIPVFLGYI